MDKNKVYCQPEKGTDERKVIKMEALAKRNFTREERLLRAKQLSEKIDSKMNTAGVNHSQVENDVQEAFKQVKARRRSSSN